MRPALLASLAVLGLLVAGCSGGGGGGATARENYSRAQSVAAEWDSDATLVSVVALEVQDVENATREIERSIHDEGGAAIADEVLPLLKALLADGDLRPGDGFAPAWGYLFVSPSGLHAVVVGASGSVTYDRDWNLPGPELGEMMPAGLDEGWTIDSDEAARIAANRSAAFRAALAAPDAQATMSLGTFERGRAGDGADVDPHVAWMVLVGDGEDSAFVWVDAGDGEVLMSYPDGPGTGPPGPGPGPTPEPAPGVEQEADSTSGTLTAAVSETETYEFRIGDGHQSMDLLLEATGTIGTVQMTATVRDPLGNEQTLRVTGVGIVASFSTTEEVLAPVPGEWSVTLHLEQGAQQDYEFSWCTDGEPRSGTADNPACAAYR